MNIWEIVSFLLQKIPELLLFLAEKQVELHVILEHTSNTKSNI